MEGGREGTHFLAFSSSLLMTMRCDLLPGAWGGGTRPGM